MAYVVLQRIHGDDTIPRDVIVNTAHIVAVEQSGDGSRIYFSAQSYWNIAEDIDTVILSIGSFNGDAGP